MTTIASRLQAVKARISDAASAAGRRPGEIVLVAVSKTFPPGAIAEAWAAGQRAFGENYVQEGVEKIRALASLSLHPGAACPEGPLLLPLEWHGASPDDKNPGSPGDVRPSDGVASPEGPLLLPLEWHYIGPIQSNKTRQIAERFSWVHSVDRLKIAQRLSEARPASAGPHNVCIQVNLSGEASKGGVSPADAPALAREIARLPRLKLRGLMTIPEPTGDVVVQRSRFRLLRELKDRIVASGLPMDSLSMGMSHDLESAIAECATMVRVGTAIFGERNTDR